MKTKLIATALLSVAALGAVPAHAQVLKPGLWEIKTTGAPGGGKALAEHMASMKKEIAAMPAEQRKQIEAAMAASNANEVQYTNDGITMKHCITKEEANLDKLIVKEGNCTTQRSPMIGGTIKMNMSCTSPPSTGNGTIRLQGDSAYTMDMTMTSNFQGQAHTAKVGSSGKWLSSNCGKVKPAAKPPSSPR